jgi:chondroitin 4-sulfotransferase 11
MYFFHIPKAAGTSICMALFGYQVGHLNFNRLYNSNPKKAMTYYKFTFVRNPWDRLISAYHFLLSGGMNANDMNWGQHNLTNYIDFNDFVKNWLNEKNINTYVHFIPQHRFLESSNRIIKVDFVGKTETLNRDIEIVSNKLGKQIFLEKINESKHASYVDYYNQESINTVSRVYERDIELFGYKFGN